MQADIFKVQYLERLADAKRMMEETNKASVLFVVQIPDADNNDLLLPVTRESLSNVVCFVEIGDISMLDFILSEADGIIDRIVLDIDMIRSNSQQIIDYVMANSSIPIMKYSDVQMWGDSAVDFVSLNEKDLQNKKVLVVGKSYLATQIVRNLLTRGVHVYMTQTEMEDVLFPVNHDSCITIQSSHLHVVSDETYFDVLIGGNMKKCLNEQLLEQYTYGRVYDIGLQNFSRTFIHSLTVAATPVYRFDNRAAVASVILRLMETEDLLKNVMGKAQLKDITLISGGIMGAMGDVVVDNVNDPSSVLGIADGCGSFVHDADYTEQDKIHIDTIQKLINQK